MGWRKHVDEDAELVKEIKQDKIDRKSNENVGNGSGS